MRPRACFARRVSVGGELAQELEPRLPAGQRRHGGRRRRLLEGACHGSGVGWQVARGVGADADAALLRAGAQRVQHPGGGHQPYAQVQPAQRGPRVTDDVSQPAAQLQAWRSVPATGRQRLSHPAGKGRRGDVG